MIKKQTLCAGTWGKLNELEDKSRPLKREALEFLGGLLIRYKDRDHEPAQLLGGEATGPSICDLADALLKDYVQQTGVNWSTRTVLGRNPFLAKDTDIIRVRFPDWSLWNLPLMAHEFGHLAALATPDFIKLKTEFQQDTIPPTLYDNPQGKLLSSQQYIEARRQHLDEFFADVFATYTFGPAFACASILHQFNPAQAYIWRGAHPTHDERVQVILLTLQAMNEKTRSASHDPGIYALVIAQLRQVWNESLKSCHANPDNLDIYNFQLRQTQRWAWHLYNMIDRFYRLGACYKPEQWKLAVEASERLKCLPYPTIEQLQEKVTKYPSLDSISLKDFVNAFWYARTGEAYKPPFLPQVSAHLGNNYLRISK